jgi:hypothetical protein
MQLLEKVFELSFEGLVRLWGLEEILQLSGYLTICSLLGFRNLSYAKLVERCKEGTEIL